jgi:tetratricopeptide (TPR) repeat protein
MVRYARTLQITLLFQEGDWDEAGRRADDFLAACDAGSPHNLDSTIRRYRARARLARDDVDGALSDCETAVGLARAAKDPQTLVPALADAARIFEEVGRIDDAKSLAHEALLGEAPGAWALAGLAWGAARLDCADKLVERFGQPPMTTRWWDAAHAVLAGDLSAAASVYSEMGDVPEEAFARLRAAEQLVARGRRTEADEQLRRSLAFWRSVGATRYIHRGAALLATAS